MSDPETPSANVALRVAKLGCGGLYLVFLLGCVAYFAWWSASMASLRERALEERTLSWEDRRASDAQRARLIARAGLARVLAEAPLLLSAGRELPPTYQSVVGESYYPGYDRYVAKITARQGERFTITVESEVVKAPEGATYLEQRQVFGAYQLQARARITPAGFELLEETLEDTTPPEEPPSNPFGLEED